MQYIGMGLISQEVQIKIVTKSDFLSIKTLKSVKIVLKSVEKAMKLGDCLEAYLRP